MTGSAVAEQQQQRDRPNNRKRCHNASGGRHANNNNARSRRRTNRRPEAEPVVPKTCAVCNEVEGPKYKCPKCRVSYCSIKCCRDHKAKGCQPPEETTTKTVVQESATSRYLPKEAILAGRQQQHQEHKTTSAQAGVRDADDWEEGWRITDAMKKALQQSEWLKRELEDNGLRQLLSTIRQGEQLDQAKRNNPHFRQFVDKLLATAGILNQNGFDDADGGLGE